MRRGRGRDGERRAAAGPIGLSVSWLYAAWGYTGTPMSTLPVYPADTLPDRAGVI